LGDDDSGQMVGRFDVSAIELPTGLVKNEAGFAVYKYAVFTR
jgi:hypothetical protein